MIKMIVTDMDGTLLDENNNIPKETVSYLKEIQKQGIKLVLASGRSYSRLKKYYELLEMEKYDSKLIEVNGLYINHLKQGIREQFEPMTKTDARLILNTIRFDVEAIAYLDKGLRYYVPESIIPLKYAEIKARNLSMETPLTSGMFSWIEDMRDGYPDQAMVGSIDEFPKTFNKLTIINDSNVIEKVYQILKAELGNQYELAPSSPRNIEITKKGITKGNALKKLMDKLNVKDDELLVFGDAGNDISMFKCVKYGIAMKNASNQLKEIAFDITDDHNHEGLLKACQKYIPKLQ